MNKTNEVEMWLKIALEDYEAAIFLKNMKPSPLEIICFHCQQSAEKDLKGYLVQNNIIIQKTHNLDSVLKKCIDVDESFIEIKKSCLRLTDYAVELRYPYRLEITEDLMDVAIKDAFIIKMFVEKRINKR